MDDLLDRIAQLKARLADAERDALRRDEAINQAKEFLSHVCLHTEDAHAGHFVGMTQRWLEAATAATGCTRSHPHEDMSPECEAKTVEAREANARWHGELRTIADLEEWKAAEALVDRMKARFTVLRCNNLAQKIADESSASLLQCSLTGPAGYAWLDTRTAEPHEDDAIKEAVEYLELRGLLERHAEQPHLVRVIEQEGK